MLKERLDQLELPLMVENNTDRHRTAFTVSVDYRHGKYIYIFITKYDNEVTNLI